jgi:hypothetical protein
MTQARSQLVNPNYSGTYHCINRCVRRSWLCGYDRYSKRSFGRRKPWVEARILELGVFACGIYSYAVMSNHLHPVVHMSPSTARDWSAIEVAVRWVKLYPAQTNELCEQKIDAIVENAELVEVYRSRLANLSWLMKSLSECNARVQLIHNHHQPRRFFQSNFNKTPTETIPSTTTNENSRKQNHHVKPKTNQIQTISQDHQPRPSAKTISQDHQPRPSAKTISQDHQPRPSADRALA